ncbi:hypothetical protein NG800_015940 [Epilithonimonas ginsengisoli]|uniref:Lipoprotein n=1 Tax=Epilithonimonas ginsengisoli TaxID=1245592 RepID=A0ABU4JLI2_9FLAO|nr:MULTISPECIES: hypothetical protein [Chryseobacterium group]MBV6881439.1 hypothetical protein [Epilithonimonas sp. FP105]MDW8550419.1 hypothetical protein [Epilithonimonas ginsengisoli]OAH73270.1 hypothetical protein AXA65_08075 [Chryseobacterium sp. FP211-J200]
MKNLLLISALIFTISCKDEKDKNVSNSSNAISSKVKSHSLSLENDLSSVDGIKHEYSKVNSQLVEKKLDSVGFKYECDEISGNVVYYSDKGVLKAIKHFQADSHFSSTENYFVNEGKPYFIFKDDTVWSFDGGTPEKPITKDDVTEQRFYLVDNKTIQCLEKKYTLRSNATSNPQSENVPNKEMKNCSIAELQKTFDVLMKNKERRGDVECTDGL